MNYELFMGEALAVARQAAERGAPPVGAIAVMNEAMVARGANRVAERNDPTAHAVVAALVFAVPNPVDGAAGSVLQLAQHPGLARRLQVVSGIRAAEAAELTADREAVAAGA